LPVQRISKGFKDISATFQVNPLNKDLIVLRNENAIARSIRNLIFTVRGEKPFEPSLGSNVSNLLFENMNQLTANAIKSEIEDTINTFESRVSLNRVKVEANYDDNAFDVLIEYNIIGIDASTQQLSFALQPTR